MKMKILAALVGAVIVTAGCVSTVSDTHTPAITWSRDNLSQRYQRSIDQAYQASVAVIQSNGVLITEYIPHDSTNSVRSLQGKVNEKNVWIRVEAVDSKTTEVTVQARSKWGVSDVSLASELLTQVALQLAR
jgi:Protein of unknown function (DUF3568)